MAQKWILPASRSEEVEHLARTLRLSGVTAGLMVNRGLSDALAARKFLEPSLMDLPDPYEHPAIREAADFLAGAVRAGKRITVFGDYDADGICATAMMAGALKLAGAQVDYYVPQRLEEGYGLNCAAVEELARRGTNVVVTVDCGVSAVEEAALARRLGLELIITDHHEPPQRLPDVPFILDPKIPEAGLGFSGLAGVGIAFKLVWALGRSLSGGGSVGEHFKEFLMDSLSLVALGTVADVAPLVDENRILVRFGLKTFPSCSLPGLKALQAVSGVGGAEVSAYDVAYKLAPRLNAGGRMGDASTAVEMLTSDDPAHARELAEHLERENRRRQSIQKAMVEEAIERVQQQVDLDKTYCIVLSDPLWHPGVVGLVASRLADNFCRPAFVFATGGQTARGSARSIPGFPLFSAVQLCEDLLEHYGGHEGAAGLALLESNLPRFASRINDVAREMMGPQMPVQELPTDGEIRLGELTIPVVDEMKMLSPFGEGNPAPRFAASGLRLIGNPQVVGSRQNHLSFLTRQDNVTLRAIAFQKADWLEELCSRADESFALAFKPWVSDFNGCISVELRAEDLQWESERLVDQGISST